MQLLANLTRIYWLIFTIPGMIILQSCGLLPDSSMPTGSIPTPTKDHVLPPLPPPLESAPYWYSPKYGWFDRSHVGFGNPESFLEQVKNAAQNGSGQVIVESGVRGVGFKATYQVDGLQPDQVEAVMAGILQDATRQFEWWQLSLGKPGSPLPENDYSYSTWFANEDLPSNQLGFIAAILKEKYNEVYQEDNDFATFYRRILADLEAEPRPNGEEEKPWSLDISEPSRNFEFNFWVPDETTGFNRVDWPARYQLELAGPQSGLWRREQIVMWDKSSEDAIPFVWPNEGAENNPAFYDPRIHQERFGVIEFCQTHAKICEIETGAISTR